MYEVNEHPILEVNKGEECFFKFEGKEIKAESGKTIATALHRAGYPVHSHSLHDRNRSLECGIGKCGACEMLVDGKIKRICITLVDGVRAVQELPKDYTPEADLPPEEKRTRIYRTTVAIIGAGPAGLATREELNKAGVDNLVIDNNDKIGGQFLMQTHQFFFFEQEKKYGGLRGFDIAEQLAGDDHSGIMLDSTVFDILEGKRLAVKDLRKNEIYYVDAEYLVIATGAIPYMPPFVNDDLPGVYTAAVVQKMMNNELTLLGKNILTVGAGNIGYLTSYQLMQAGANVKAVIEAMDHEGGFPVQANRVRRLGIPVITSHILLEAVPNENNDGIVGAIVAECKDFKAIPGTEKLIDGIDAINICTGLVPDNPLFVKGKELYGRDVWSIGDAYKIGEGTSAVLHGKKVAYEILEAAGKRFNYHDFLTISKEHIDSQQEPTRVIEKPAIPSKERQDKPFVILDCVYGFACNPCQFACPHGAISKTSTSNVPEVDYDKCTGCMECVWQCPGLAIFGYNKNKQKLFLPIEYEAEEKSEVYLVNNQGEKLGTGVIEKILKKPNKTNIARVKANDVEGEDLMNVRGFIVKENYPEEVEFKDTPEDYERDEYICHCDDVKYETIEKVIGDRKFISIDVIKHTTRLGMGACRGKRCTKRLRSLLWTKGVELVGDPTPRGPMSNQITMGDLYPKKVEDQYIPNKPQIRKEETEILIAGGGIGGSALMRYFAEAGKKPIMINYGRGSSWRNIMGGRPVFSMPEMTDIAEHNLEIFKELDKKGETDFRPIKYVTLAHDQEMYDALTASQAWSDAKMIEAKDFQKEISPYFNPNLDTYSHALITDNCWQATPGKIIDLTRKIGKANGGTVMENTELIDVYKNDEKFVVLVHNHQDDEYIEFTCDHFINALGIEADKFARKLDIQSGLYPVKHQAFITRRMPMLGIDKIPLPMIIDRRNYKGFSAVYGQQLAETGQIIGCASPANDPRESGKNQRINSRDFVEIVSETFTDWIPELSSVGFQAVWAGYYVEPRMLIDTNEGLFIGLRGQGYMLGMYLAQLYVKNYLGLKVPTYFDRLSLSGDGMPEKAFK
jgi:glycine/D-amino acid oxidase-like deaminating enzyme/Fe-S-cluster-containing hydrogenase component 2/bacterioferritin-associated ferredoxin